MSRQISRAESWEAVYQAFQNINFAAFDYNTIKQSLISYFQLTHPEYNNYIESDEFVMIIEAFAYVSELYAYRLDVDAHENLLPLAQRKDSILQLAKLVSYTASRNIPSRGIVKIMSVQTTERVIDARGLNLANSIILWNDITNQYWKEQFLLVMNLILHNTFGTVTPADRIQVYDQIFELYELNNIPLTNNVISYSVSISGVNVPMELTPVSLDVNGPYERRPERNSNFSILYGTDGLGDSSNTTGFFMYTKQGNLSRTQYTYDGVTPNQTTDLKIDNINDTDVWLNNVDTKGVIINDFSVINTVSGAWVPVESAYSENIIFNTVTQRNKYEVETLDNDNIRLVFGDGDFTNIPLGSFDLWYRTSLNQDLIIPTSAIYEMESSLAYTDINNVNQILYFSFSSIQTIQNAAPSEDLEHIRKMAAAVYYTQDRMVNNRDYNSYLLQDQTILKLKAVNRSFAGQSQYMGWYDASSTYANVKIFGDDLAIFYIDEIKQIINIPQNSVSSSVVFNYVVPLLSLINNYMHRVVHGYPTIGRRYLTEPELHELIYSTLGEVYYSTDLHPFTPVFPVFMKYVPDPITQVYTWVSYNTNNTSDNSWLIMIDRTYDGINYNWTIYHKTTKINAGSNTTKFWYANNKTITNYESLNSVNDTVTILKANTGSLRTSNNTNILTSNIDLIVLGAEISTQGGQNTGLNNTSALNIATEDTNLDGWPDDIKLTELINNVIVIPKANNPVTITINYPFSIADCIITGDINNNIIATFNNINQIATSVTIPSFAGNNTATITIMDYVYFYRVNTLTDWIIVSATTENITQWLLDTTNTNYKRLPGRSDLNFLWTHYTVSHHLIDPNTTNIIDAFIITRGYYLSVRTWLDGTNINTPVPPTPLALATTYNALLANKMISDNMILHPGNLKIIFGKHAIPQLQASIVVVKSVSSNKTDNQVKTAIVNSVKSFFTIVDWDFGMMFNFTELAAKIHYDLLQDIDTVVLVPLYATNFFGDLFQINVSEAEILIPDITISDINIVATLNHINIKQLSKTF